MITVYIDTNSKESMEESICKILDIDNIKLDELLDNCYNKLQVNHKFLDMDEQYDFFLEYVKEHLVQPIDEIMFVHLARRLNGDNDNTGYNLVDVLTKETTLSNYLKDYDLTFKYNQYIKMYIKDKEVDITDNLYLKDRFESKHQDYSIGGYVFMDCIKDNDYYNIAIGGPKFFGHLYPYDIDDDAIIDNFIENSIFYQFEYAVPIKDIEFENYEDLDEKERMYHIIIIALQRLYFCKYDPMFNKQENQVVKMSNNKNIDAKYLVNKKIL